MYFVVTFFVLSVASALTRFKSSNCVNTVNIIFNYNLFNSAARQNIDFVCRDNGARLLLVAFLFLVNIAQIADEILLMVCLLLRHQYLRNQVTLLTIEYMIETCEWLNRSS